LREPASIVSVVDTHDLLAACVHTTGENSALAWRAHVGIAADRPTRDTRVLEVLEQGSSRLVAADDADRQGARAEGTQVGHRVSSSTRDDDRLAVDQDRHRRLAGDPRDVAVDKLVGHEIAEDRDTPALEAAHEIDQMFASGGRSSVCALFTESHSKFLDL